MADTTNMEPSGNQGVSGQPQQQFSIQGGPSNLNLPQPPHCVSVLFETPGARVYQGELASSTPNSELEAQKRLLQNQIEVSSSALNRLLLLLLLLLLYNVQLEVNLISKYWQDCGSAVFSKLIDKCYSKQKLRLRKLHNFIQPCLWELIALYELLH